MRVCHHVELQNKLENKLRTDGKNFVTERDVSDSLHAMRAYQDAHQLA